MVKAKVVCSVNEEVPNSNGGHKVVFHPVTFGSKENEEYFTYTPGGEIRLEILNKGAYEQFEFGKEYYVTFESAS